MHICDGTFVGESLFLFSPFFVGFNVRSTFCHAVLCAISSVAEKRRAGSFTLNVFLMYCGR